MAKFVQVGYGHDGRGTGDTESGYTYIVNDSVRAGDTIVPIRAFNVKANRDIVTTAKVISTAKTLDRASSKVDNEAIKEELETKGLVSLDEDGKIGSADDCVDTSGLKYSGTKPIRSYGNQAQFESKLKGAQSEAKEINRIEGKQAEVESAFGGETYDSYVANWKAKQDKGD